MSTELAPDFLSKIVTVFSQEVSYIIEHFGGFVLKFVGDASIGYFPSSQNFDDIVLCGESVVYVVRNAINPLLLQMAHSGIEVKVTSDYGQHTIVRYGSDRERSHVDIIIATMNNQCNNEPCSENAICHKRRSNGHRRFTLQEVKPRLATEV